MGLSPKPVCVRRTPPARPCVWPSVPCWSTGKTAYPHSQLHAWKQSRPAITWMHRAASQWMRRLGVAPELVVPGVGNVWTGPITLMQTKSADHFNALWVGPHLGFCGFPRTHAVIVGGVANPAKCAGGYHSHPYMHTSHVLVIGSELTHEVYGVRLPARTDLKGPSILDHGSFPIAGLCATDSTSTPVRLVLGPMLVHRRHSLSASAGG